MAEHVKKGDIIRLNKGMNIKVTLPEMYCDNEKPSSKEKVRLPITIGEILKTIPYSRKEVEEKVTEFCLKELGTNVSRKVVKDFVDSLPIDYQVKIFDTKYFEGEYIVVEARYLNIRIYPYYVKCRKRDDESVFVEFYQSCSVAKCNNDDVEVIGHI